MAVRKKKSVGASKANLKKPKNSKRKAKRSPVRQVVDQVLVKISPQLRKKMNSLKKSMAPGDELRSSHLSVLAGQILERAQSISRRLKNLKRGKKK